MSLGKSEAPPAPDYRGAAIETAQGNAEAARVAAAANRVNQVTPYGNLTYTNANTNAAPTFNQSGYDAALQAFEASKQAGAQNAPTFDPSNGWQGSILGVPGATGSTGAAPNQSDYWMPGTGQDQWTATQSLSPTGQQLFDSQSAISLGLGKLGETGLGYVQDTLNKPFDWSNLPKAPVNAGQTAQQAIMARLQPQMNQQNDAFTTQMMNQGIAPGSVAYENARRSIGQQQNDLMSQAALYGINLDTTGRQQAIQEQSFGRNEPLNMLNAVRSGAQVQNPQFVNVPQQQTVAGPNFLGATQATSGYNTDVFNQQQAQQGNTMNSLFKLGGLAMGGGGFSPFGF